MAYEKQEFTNGQILTAEQLNRMSEGISSLQDECLELAKYIDSMIAKGILEATVE